MTQPHKFKFLPTLVVLLNLACMNFICTDNFWDSRASCACTILLLAAVLQSYRTSIASWNKAESICLGSLSSNTQLQSGTGGGLTATLPLEDRSKFYHYLAFLHWQEKVWKPVFHASNKAKATSWSCTCTVLCELKLVTWLVSVKTWNLIKCVVMSRSSPLPSFLIMCSCIPTLCIACPLLTLQHECMTQSWQDPNSPVKGFACETSYG